MTRQEALQVVTLGTAGGPAWVRGGGRAGIATAVVVEGRTYLVDAGHGVGRQLEESGLGLPSLEGIFITHMHSDHIVDLPGLMAFSPIRLRERKEPIAIVGPGPRGCLPHVAGTNEVVDPTYPAAPTPGITESVDLMQRAFATDTNDRRADAHAKAPAELFSARDIVLPPSINFHANTSPYPDMDPVVVYEDDVVRVSAALVKHAPMAPAFGYRFETESGVVALSGDTAPIENMARLAENADLLLHEALDMRWAKATYGDSSDPSERAIYEHHLSAHTSPAGAAAIAEKAGAKRLALHHLLPLRLSEREWVEVAGNDYAGEIHVPDDLHVFRFS